ncbi:hypothetical protein GPECTOR_312g1 [Gonium pectorale]|uniref:Right handed beta helix domain-containing protein n=1 Tax=Gonium pectorale TaxID=33097 RepID=A0A150FWW9_GONPE|nr:hypothetical protein GPECTOR_312g1 [Gonium pectorale]|eukprot:KXZ41705.1 hypothetical protein GPECTOR_312g1 [Gonium pectorale]
MDPLGGGAIYVSGQAQVLAVQGGSAISRNSAEANGGAIYVDDTVNNLAIDGSSNISGNLANGSGMGGSLPPSDEEALNPAAVGLGPIGRGAQVPTCHYELNAT